MPPRPLKPKSLPKGAPEPSPSNQSGTSGNKPQFSILGMFVVMLICSLASAGAYYLVRAEKDPSFKIIAVSFLVAGPMLLMVVVSLLVAVMARWK
jgi:RsiW-degrading membrane proteinase PrsW (M82 family)